jgi:FemAB-related protein (PEP-CTERM system-associated)
VNIYYAKESDREAWDSYVLFNGKPIYFLFDFKKAFERCYGLTTIYLIARDNDEIVGILPAAIVGFLKKQIVSLPYVYYGGAIANCKQIEEALYSELSSYATKHKIYGLTFREREQKQWLKMPCDHGNYFFQIPLMNSEENTFKNLGHAARKHINIAKKQKFQCSFGRDQLSDFYKIYTARMHQLGTPCHSIKFWHTLLELFPNNSNVIVVRDGNNIAAAMFYLYTDAVFSDVIAISLPEYRDKRAYYWLHWRAICWAVEQGIKTFDFERSQKGGGTYTFKRTWGGQERMLYYYNSLGSELIQIKRKFQPVRTLWSKLPLSITRLCGPSIRKYIS